MGAEKPPRLLQTDTLDALLRQAPTEWLLQELQRRGAEDLSFSAREAALRERLRIAVGLLTDVFAPQGRVAAFLNEENGRR